MQLVDQTCLHILPDGRDSASDADIFTAADIFRALQSSVDSLGHEMEGRPALHLNRVSRVVRQNKDWDVIGRRIAPPSLPRFIRPWSTNRSKHISSQDPRAHILHATSRPFVVQARRAAFFPVHLLPCASRKKPLEQIGTPHTERIIHVLARTCAVTIQRNGKRTHTNFRHTGHPPEKVHSTSKSLMKAREVKRSTRLAASVNSLFRSQQIGCGLYLEPAVKNNRAPSLRL